MSDLLLISLFLAVPAALPFWPYSRNWGYAPGAGLAGALAVVAVMMVAGVF